MSSTDKSLKKRSPSGAGSSNNKVSRSDTMSSPSSGATVELGAAVLDRSLRSVLAHELCLPLLFFLYGKKPSELAYLRRDCHFTRITAKWGDTVLTDAITAWEDIQEKREKDLTDAIASEVVKLPKLRQAKEDFIAASEVSLTQSHARVDIIFSDSDTLPLAIVEVGLINKQWYKKLHQGFSYLDLMLQEEEASTKFDRNPILLICLTVERGSLSLEEGICETRLAVFLCTKRITQESPAFRASLLWHDAQSTLTGASASFGKVLRAVSNFNVWRKPQTDGPDYEYLSSTCCRVGTKVLRCYDYRVRHTERSSLFYRDHQNLVKQVYKEKSEYVCCFDETDLTKAPRNMNWKDWSNVLHQKPVGKSPYNVVPRSDFWEKRGPLLVIAVPFIDGDHRALSPKAFLPVLNQLEELHENNLVFADVRGCNLIFTDGGKQGTLIDFDLCGQAGTGLYPAGYRHLLDDGTRQNVAGKVMRCWHDIDALVHLIFDFHVVEESKSQSSTDVKSWSWRKFWKKRDNVQGPSVNDKIRTLQKFWRKVNIDQGPSEEDFQQAISDLRNILSSEHLTLEPTNTFDRLLEEEVRRHSGTKEGATGSPPKRKERT